MPHVRPASESGPTQATAPLAGNGGRPATIAAQRGCRRRTNTVQKKAFGISPGAQHGLTMPRERHDRPAPRWGDYDVRNGSLHLAGHYSRFQRGMSVIMFDRLHKQTPNPGAVTPPELQTQVHNHVTAGQTPKDGRPGRVYRNLPKSVFDVNPTQDSPSVRIV